MMAARGQCSLLSLTLLLMMGSPAHADNNDITPPVVKETRKFELAFFELLFGFLRQKAPNDPKSPSNIIIVIVPFPEGSVRSSHEPVITDAHASERAVYIGVDSPVFVLVALVILAIVTVVWVRYRHGRLISSRSQRAADSTRSAIKLDALEVPNSEVERSAIDLYLSGLPEPDVERLSLSVADATRDLAHVWLNRKQCTVHHHCDAGDRTEIKSLLTECENYRNRIRDINVRLAKGGLGVEAGGYENERRDLTGLLTNKVQQLRHILLRVIESVR